MQVRLQLAQLLYAMIHTCSQVEMPTKFGSQSKELVKVDPEEQRLSTLALHLEEMMPAVYCLLNDTHSPVLLCALKCVWCMATALPQKMRPLALPIARVLTPLLLHKHSKVRIPTIRVSLAFFLAVFEILTFGVLGLGKIDVLWCN